MIYPEQLKGKKIWMNGQVIEASDASFHIMAHGLHYATAAFEGIRVYNGKAFLLKEHVERLGHSSSVLLMDVTYSIEELCDAINNLIRVNNISYGYVRPLIWRGAEAILLEGVGTKVHAMIAVWESFEGRRIEQRKNGYRLKYSPYPKFHQRNPFGKTKASCVYPLNYIMKKEAVQAGFDDCIALDLDGYVTELSSSNLFLINNGELLTPVADCFLNGLTRQTIIKIAKQLNIQVVEKKISKTELKNATAAFATGTAIEMIPIKSIEATSFAMEHPIFLKLEEEFKSMVAQL